MTFLFLLVSFLSAFLLFALQPLVAKLILPSLGSTPNVWNTCALFFQMMLLCGYGLVHLACRVPTLPRQIGLYLALLLAICVNVHFSLTVEDLEFLGTSSTPTYDLLRLLLIRVGPAIIAFTFTAPLLQSWYCSVTTSTKPNPYHLYAASNLGSLLGLLLYPFVIEPAFTLGAQQMLVANGFALFVLSMLLLICGLLVTVYCKGGLPRAPVVEDTRQVFKAEGIPTLSDRAKWVLLAVVPTSFSLAVTTHITSDISPIPLLWIFPLSLYLLSFIFAFAPQPIHPSAYVRKILAMSCTVLLLLHIVDATRPISLIVGLDMLALFLCGWWCHSQLYRMRPHPRWLTEFYFYVGLGGVIGSAFNSIVAPLVFDSIVEYPVILIAAVAVGANSAAFPRKSELVRILAVWIVGFCLLKGFTLLLQGDLGTVVFALLCPSIVLAYSLIRRPFAFALALVSLSALQPWTSATHDKTIAKFRNFYGVVHITENKRENLRKLVHGNIVHGAQALDEQAFCEPLTYYHRLGPAAAVLQTLTESSAKVGVIGLGIGSLACYAKATQTWIFYEINPIVAALAQRQELFTYLARSKAAFQEIVLGDARISLRNSTEKFDLLVLDAFSSDAIPTHLLTREAFELYFDRLNPKGSLLLHVSNDRIDLVPVIAAAAAHFDVRGFVMNDLNPTPERGRLPSQWILLTHVDKLSAPVPSAQPLEGFPKADLWSDDYTDIMAVVRWW
jgi:hypothetical protein